MPSTSRNARSVRTMSATVMTGKSDPYGRPVAGSIDDGPVVPRQPPSRFVETTKNRSVSNALPGPIIPSHQPRPLPAVRRRDPRPRTRRGCSPRRRLREAGRVGVAAERVADQDDVVARRGQRAVGLVRDPDRVQLPTAVERHRVGRSRYCVSTVPTEPAASARGSRHGRRVVARRRPAGVLSAIPMGNHRMTARGA